ncbi:hypothetical protein AtDm6_2146 [Acetobacter tropicalis]|uniref:Uncharacterized protein n=1 Tax=Acetobacter tropicalis TaxID=104102 RepID=A0A094YKJ0_9PROT|nr:hypothetical protein AtDm6_2146 [Acetobacter tropicalis]
MYNITDDVGQPAPHGSQHDSDKADEGFSRNGPLNVPMHKLAMDF